MNEVSKESSDSATNIRRKGPDGGGNSKGGKSLLMCNMDSFNSLHISFFLEGDYKEVPVILSERGLLNPRDFDNCWLVLLKNGNLDSIGFAQLRFPVKIVRFPKRFVIISYSEGRNFSVW